MTCATQSMPLMGPAKQVHILFVHALTIRWRSGVAGIVLGGRGAFRSTFERGSPYDDAR